jgi:hypothetical protein
MAITTAFPILTGTFQWGYDPTIPAILMQRWTGTAWETEWVLNLTTGLIAMREVYALGTLAADYTTASATYVATGHTAVLTPIGTAIEVVVDITVQNSTINDGVGIALYRTAGSAPVAGAAFGGSDTKVWEQATTHAIAACNMQVGNGFVDTGLTAGTPYTYYVVMKAITGGTAKEVGQATLVNASTLQLENE